ncbi:ShlB/FhaC/HecB family hemolysin secretion/activation protein [Vacuolonema iberomarrocanum]|uniref:ShlB/FhaC/HecB family hemolysin secretion/activation protein n=1 Tax=Vacuolonema iberomarrocanum TaxID=3454632 RepID=UPI0019E0F113|nr:BamA/TamA family outer membrane protein [filamentous cyanobacterium LEGE 07170]
MNRNIGWLATAGIWAIAPGFCLAQELPAEETGLRPLTTVDSEATVSTEAAALSPVLDTIAPERSPGSAIAQVSPPLPTRPSTDVNPSEDDSPFLQPAPTPTPISPPEEQPLIEEPPAEPTPPPAPDDAQRFTVSDIVVTGNTAFDEGDLEPIYQEFLGRSLTFEELQEIADRITQLYLNEGFLTSRAILESPTGDGVVRVRVIEGELETIEVEGNQRVPDSYIRSRVALGADTPVNQFDLEDQLRLLRLDPLFDNVEASLRAGDGLGQSILVVRVTEAEPFFGAVSIDNYSPASVGSERMNLELGYRNLTGLGDTVSMTLRRTTTGGARLYDFNYRVPVNPREGTLSVRIAPSDFDITDPAFDQLNINGNTELYEVSFRQPFIRTPRTEAALSIGLSYRDGETLFGNIILNESTITALRFGQDVVLRDSTGAWSVRSQFSIGTTLLDATTDGNPDGQFFSWLGQLQRVQILNPDNLLILQADVQLTPDALLAPEQFSIGGGQSLRGFRQNARLGDNGVRLSAENRITLGRNEAGAPIFQLAPFADMGWVWNDGDNPRDTPDQPFLAGVGLGLIWQPSSQFDLRLDYALPLIDLDDRGNNAQDQGLYFSVVYRL